MINVIALIMGVMCLLYYIIIINYVGVDSSFALFWLFTGIGLILVFVIISLCNRYEIRLPSYLSIPFLIIVILGIGIFVWIEGMIITNSKQVADAKADYLIVLGAQVKGTKISKALKRRLDVSIRYLKDNVKTIVIVAGGRGKYEDITEAQAMREYLLVNGVGEARIILEDKSRNTIENIRNSRALIRDTSTRIVLVTSDFHIFRALSIAKKQGLSNTQGISSPSDPILFINYYVREALGVLKDKWKGNM